VGNAIENDEINDLLVNGAARNVATQRVGFRES